MSFIGRAAGFRSSFRNADTDQGDPRRRITRRKGLNQALSDFVGVRGRFNFSQKPGIRVAFAASKVRWFGRHRRFA
jgi:hypothetical protein